MVIRVLESGENDNDGCNCVSPNGRYSYRGEFVAPKQSIAWTITQGHRGSAVVLPLESCATRYISTQQGGTPASETLSLKLMTGRTGGQLLLRRLDMFRKRSSRMFSKSKLIL